MYVRLAFAVAAHLEPEILVVDEVLAVGDAEFQKKCLGKMSEVAGGGRTVLFVSHNLAAIEALCPRSLYLVSGALLEDFSSEAVIATYLKQKREPSQVRSDRELFRTVFSSNAHVFRRLRPAVTNLWKLSSNSAQTNQVSYASVLPLYIRPKECGLQLWISVNVVLCRCVTGVVNLR